MQSTQMEQFFRGILVLIVVIVLGTAVTGYMKTHYSSFQTTDETEMSS